MSRVMATTDAPHRSPEALRAARDFLLGDLGAHLRPYFRPVAYRPVPDYAYGDLLDAGMAHAAMADHFEDEEEVRQDSTGAHMYAMMAALATYGMPAYLVSGDLLQAAHLSRLPGEMPLEELRTPFPAMSFILPTAEALRSPEDLVYNGLAIARLPPGELTTYSMAK